MTRRTLLNISRLPGEHRSRVFLGGSYLYHWRSLLDDLANIVTDAGLQPIIADKYHLPVPERDIHDLTLFLLHSCRSAIFELSTPSGAFIEIERALDYGVRSLVLHDVKRDRLSRMVTSLVTEHPDRITLMEYDRIADAKAVASSWIQSMRRLLYGQKQS